MSHKLKLLSLNVRGLRNTSKRRAIFSYLKAQKATIFFLQETYSLIEDEKVWSEEWGNNILFSHGSAHSRGVCIRQNPCSTSVRLCSISTDAEGRLIIAKVIIENKPFFILNIYAPTDYRDQDTFIKTISVSNYDNKFEDFIEGLDIPQLSEEEQEPLETELTLEELKDTTIITDNPGSLKSHLRIIESFENV